MMTMFLSLKQFVNVILTVTNCVSSGLLVAGRYYFEEFQQGGSNQNHVSTNRN